MNPDILNTILGCLGGLLFCLGWVWLNKTEDDEVLASHINDLQTKKVDTDTHATDLAAIEADITALETMQNHKARAYRSGTQSNIPNETLTKVLFNAETYDPNGDFDADGVDSRYIAPVSGWYLIHGQVSWLAYGEVGLWELYIWAPGLFTRSVTRTTNVAEEFFSLSISDILYVEAGQAITLDAKQTTGTANPGIQGTENGTFLAIHRLSI